MTVKDALKSIPSPTGCDEIYELEKILSSSFIHSVTDCADADELFADADFDGQSGFDNLDVAVLDKIIANHSDFSSFSAFIQAAVYRYHREAQS